MGKTSCLSTNLSLVRFAPTQFQCRSCRLQKGHPIDDLQKVVTADAIVECQKAVREIHVDDKVKKYVLEIVHGSREHEDVMLGGSPRASIALFRTAQALAAINGRDFATPDDVKKMVISLLDLRDFISSSLWSYTESSNPLQLFLFHFFIDFY